MFAPCGMNCKVCYKHCYHKKPCAGCLNSDKGKPEHCRKCKIKDCIQTKALSYCFECAEYPCKLIKNLEKSYKESYHKNVTIKKAVTMTAKLTETTDSGELSASREITVVKIENNWYIFGKVIEKFDLSQKG